MYTYVHSSSIHKSHKVEAASTPINRLNKTYSGILSSHTKEWSSDTCHNMGEPWNHHAKWNKTDIKEHILCNSIDMYRIDKSIETVHELVVTGAGCEERGETA